MRLRDRVTTGAALAAVAFGVLAIGGVLRWTQAAVALVVGVALASTLLSKRGFARVSPLSALLFTAAALTALQLVPLPDAIVDRMEPTTAALRSDGAELMDVSRAHTLTSDVPATSAALIFVLTLAGLAIIALRMSVSEQGRYRLHAFVALLAGSAAVVVAVHKLFGLRMLYGFYEPADASPTILGPLLNTNSLACLMAIGAMVSIGLCVYRRQPSWLRAIWLAITTGCGAITVSTVSRGATLAFAAGAFITIGAIVAQRLAGTEGSKRRRGRFLTTALPIGVVSGCMVVLVIWMNATHVEKQLHQFSFDELHYSRSKFAAWQSSIDLVKESPWMGVGRGAFESSFTRVHPASGFATYSHLENEYLQTVVDWGVPGAILLGACAIWFLVVAFRRWRDGPLTAGALGAVVVVGIQSNVDFGIEFLGIAAPITIVAATLAYVPLRELRRPALVRSTRAAHILGLAAGALLLLSARSTTLDEDHDIVSRRPTLANVRASIERHPLDYFSYAVAADMLANRGDPRAIRVLNYSLLLHPTHPDLHRMAARMLLRDGYIDQAAIEYSVALRSTSDPKKILSEILTKLTPEKVSTALPIDYASPELLVRLLVEQGHPEIATAWLERVLAQRPQSSRACDELAKLAVAGSKTAAEVAGRKCATLIPDYETRLALARILSQEKDFELVIALLYDVETWQSRADDKITAWLVLCDSLVSGDRIDDAKRCLHRLDASPDMRRERETELLNRLEELQKRARDPLLQDGATVTGSAAAPQ